MTDVLILAAGLGTRMKSRRAKVLHELGGLPLITHVVRSARELAPANIYIVVGHQSKEVESAVRMDFERRRSEDSGATPNLVFSIQTEQRGTGDAVRAAAAEFG